MTRAFILALAIILCSPLGVAQATERRIAMVIGNGNYNARDVDGPVPTNVPKAHNDARAVAHVLSRLQFSIFNPSTPNAPLLDRSLSELRADVSAFESESAGYDVSLIYYVGHGVRVGGVQYVV
jgi:uncharacterized caspase-like protein